MEAFEVTALLTSLPMAVKEVHCVEPAAGLLMGMLPADLAASSPSTRVNSTDVDRAPPGMCSLACALWLTRRRYVAFFGGSPSKAKQQCRPFRSRSLPW